MAPSSLMNVSRGTFGENPRDPSDVVRGSGRIAICRPESRAPPDRQLTLL
jgi:hypothetical protein